MRAATATATASKYLNMQSPEARAGRIRADANMWPNHLDEGDWRNAIPRATVSGVLSDPRPMRRKRVLSASRYGGSIGVDGDAGRTVAGAGTVLEPDKDPAGPRREGDRRLGGREDGEGRLASGSDAL